ncbi:MAG: carboxypeptidase-like regulatory domain-containing protein, partial [Rikenellaceae bacterium]
MNIKFKNLSYLFTLSLLMAAPYGVEASGVGEKSVITILQVNENPLKLKVAIDVKNATPQEFFTKLKKSCNGKISFVYSPTDLAKMQNITISKTNITIEELLNSVLTKDSGLTYSVEKNIITIKKVKKVPVSNEKIEFSGKILDYQKKPIAGATLIIAGTNNGAITDDKGQFSLNGAVGQQVEISYVGMVNKKYILSASEKNITIELKKDAMQVDDVIVTGYQSVKRERMTGSSTTVTAREIEGRGLSSIEEVLSSTISGLN